MKKKCNKCNLTKPLSAFNPAKGNKDGRRNKCKVCLNKYKNQHKKDSFQKKTEEENLMVVMNQKRI